MARTASASTPTRFPASRARRTRSPLLASIQRAKAPTVENQNFRAQPKELRCPRDAIARFVHRAFRTLHDETPARSAAFFPTSLHTRLLPRGSHTQATPAAGEFRRTLSGTSTNFPRDAKIQDALFLLVSSTLALRCSKVPRSHNRPSP